MVLVFVAGVVPYGTTASPLSVSSVGVNRREPIIRPSQLGDATVDGLQYADPSEGLALVSPPDASSAGTAQLSYPFVIPPGRGITPNLKLSYDSSGGNGWVGLGWGLSVGEISVDTRFGAPHFSQSEESETYLIDGAALVPTANDGPWEPRLEGDRQDFTRQTETKYEQIIRHDADDGDAQTTDDYYWEVRDKGGNIRWYGGFPDAGGPYGFLQEGGETIDPSAIVYDDDGNAVRWLLSAERDVGVNVIRYSYDTVEYARTTAGWTPQDCDPSGAVMCGRHTYLSRIRYTEAAEVAPDPNDPDPDNRAGDAFEGDAPYEVRFLRESSVNPSATVRADPVINASGRFVDVVVDRLARLEVRHGDPADGAPRNYDAADSLAVQYDLGYTTGPFGKSLLTTVTQVAQPPEDSATHTFTYNDEVLADDGSYDGFAERALWQTGEDLGDRLFLDENVSIGALGSSETNSAEGHAYIGFNPLIPDKGVGSFGASIQIGAGGTEALAEWLDLNGDGLPDKVFRDGSDVRFRLNQSGPDGGVDFTDDDAVGGDGLPRLSRDVSINFQLSVEAHIVVTAIFGLGGQVSIGDSYFTDVNADGLPDFVSGGSVYFNHLNADGVPTFEQGSGGTEIPLPLDGAVPTIESDQLDEVQADLEAQSPPIDTVRRWTAPLTGRVSIVAPVHLTSDDSPDGVRVAIEHNGDDVSEPANLISGTTTAFADPITVDVARGEHLYFRVGSIYDGTNDEVEWSPVITYTAIAGVTLSDVGPEVNGLSQTAYSSAADFTLAGRPNSVAVVPYDGTVQVTAEVDKVRATSDDVRVVVLHNGMPVTVVDDLFPASFTGPRTVTASFTVLGPDYPTEDAPNTPARQDTVEVYLAADSPIDLTAIDWEPTLVYTDIDAVDADGNPIEATLPNGDPRVQVDLLPEIEQYPNRSGTSVSTPWTAAASGTFDLVASLNTGPNSPGGRLFATIKDANGTLVAKAFADVGAGAPSAFFDLNAPLVAGTQYFADVMIRDPQLSDVTTLAGAALRPDGAPDATTDVPVTTELRWRGRQTIFPLAYRGWAVAGYTASGDKGGQPIDPVAFEVNEGQFDEANAPDGFDDIDIDNPGSQLEPAYAFIPVIASPIVPGGPVPIAGPHWVGPRENIAASATLARTSRYGADSVEITGGGAGGDGRGVTRVGLTIPSAALAVGIGPLGGSFGVSPGFGLVDYEDMNADGYPDVITPGTVHFTDQRGAFLPGSTSVADLAVANQDLTFAVTGGLAVDLVDIKGNSKGKSNATQGPAAAKGGDADDSSLGAGIGGGISASWTSPNASGGDPGVPSTYDDAVSQIPDESTGGTAPIQIALADVNADGLSDRVFTTPQGVFAQYNLGYRFTSQTVRLTTGGFQSMESYAGNVSAGFSTPWAEFSGGASFNWNFDQARYTWIDVNGDGILDQLRKREGGEAPQVAFGTGSGVLSPVEYGDVETVDPTLIPGGQQVSFDRASGFGVQFDFTVYIGPLCLVACYLVINPGASFQNSVSSTQVDLADVNGDGYADSLSTTDDDELYVRLNNAGKTNLLETVANPLGGTVSLSYERDGNTVDHPSTTWSLSRVAVDDGRPGDGPNVQATNYDYSGLAYDRVHRTSLGYSAVTATEMNTETNPEQPLRVTVTEYHNDNVFVTGLARSVTTSTPDGALLQRATTTWEFRDVGAVGAGFDVLAEVDPVDLTLIGDTSSVASRGRSIAPLAVRVDEEFYEGGALPAQATNQTFRYDGLGNVLVQSDAGEPEDPNDDLVATYDYADCNPGSDSGLNLSASTMTDFADLNGNGEQDAGEAQFYPEGCLGPVTRPSTIWSHDLCPTWVSLPVAIRITNGKTGAAEVVFRDRDGRDALCDNASMTRHVESIDGTVSPTPTVPPAEECPEPGLAVTLLTYDSWGSYNRIIYPPDADCTSYAVSYIWDLDGHGKVGEVTEYDLADGADIELFLDGTNVPAESLADPAVHVGLTSVATFDPLAGRVASRTDANGNTVEYTYDSLGRIASIGSPRPEDTEPLVTFEYRPSAAGYGYATARHLDIFNPGDTIDTYTFVDGIGRRTQTKRDARLFQAAGVAPVIGRAVSGATNFDALGRAIEQFYPTQDTQASATTFETVESTAALPERTEWDLRDRPTTITAPGNRLTQFAYGSAPLVAGGPVYRTTAVTEPNLRVTTTFTDAREITRASDDKPAAFTTALRTVFDHDAMGQLRLVTDTAGNQTSHTYDLMGRRTSTTTPDGGLVEFGFDPEGKLVSKTTPNLRADGTAITYAYEFGRLLAIDHPSGTPDVGYEYGEPGDGVNGAGRVVREEDGSRIVVNEYAPSGALVEQLAEMKYHDWFNPGSDKSKFQTTTSWRYDGLGRMASMVYPDGEELTYDYDAGGLAQSIVGAEEGLIRVQVGVDAEGNPIFEDQPHAWTYDYLDDRQYDQFLTPRWQQLGNGVTTEYTYDANTRWLSRQQSISPNRSVTDPLHREIQDLNYTYDSVGNPTEYRNALPPAIPSEFTGTTVQHYRYDPLERIVGASAIYELPNKRHQRYELSIAYDVDGNVATKNQYDAVVKKPMPAAPTSSPPIRGELPNAETTYSFSRTYNQPAPHQATATAEGSYRYDANGNLLGILEAAPDKWVRRLEWDANDRLTLVDDDGSTTEFAYDDTGQRTIERGPNGGETAFVNPWVSTRNKNEMYKHIWVDDTRLAAQRDDGEFEELKRYFLHTDLQGSTNLVTDHLGDTFQHHEYFATGETWIDEHSTVFRTPYQYAGGYVDDARDTINFGARWYDQDRELFYSPDPVLYDDATAIMERPALAAAYAFAGSNPVTNIDPRGLEFFTARNRAAVEAKHEDVRKYIARNPAVAAAVVANLDTRIPSFLVRRGITADPKTDRLQALSELLDNKPIVEIDLSAGTVSFSFTIGKQFTFPRTTTQAATSGPARPTQPLPDPANAQPAIGPASAGVAQANGGVPVAAQQADAQPSQQAPPRPTSALPTVAKDVPRSDQ